MGDLSVPPGRLLSTGAPVIATLFQVVAPTGVCTLSVPPFPGGAVTVRRVGVALSTMAISEPIRTMSAARLPLKSEPVMVINPPVGTRVG